MNIHKKTLPFVLAVSIIVGTLGGTPAYAASEEQDDNSGGVIVTFESGNLKYTVTNDNETKEVEVSKCLNENLENIEIPSKVTNDNTEFSVTSIGEQAFSDCESLQSITIPESITEIKILAFEECSSLTEIDIPDSVTFIGLAAFNACTSLQHVKIGKGVEKISSAFQNCDSLTEIDVDENNETYSSENGVLFKNDKEKSKVILDRYPEGKTDSEYTIPDNVTSIEAGAFKDCNNLEQINISDSVTDIESQHNCNNLTAINVDKNNETYSSENGVLFNHDKTILVQYPEGKTDSEYTIPDSVTNIKDHAFVECNNLESIDISENVTNIGYQAFSSCGNLSEIVVVDENKNYSSKNGVLFNQQKTTIIQYPIKKTDTSYTIPDSVTSIGEFSFSVCENLQNITIPNSVTNIGAYSFSSCENLQSITIPNSVTSIGENAFYQCYGLQTVTIKDGITDIGEYAFSNCTSLQRVTIPNSVSSIGEDAFSDCLDNLTLIVEKGSYAEQYAKNNGITYTDSNGSPQASTIDDVTQAIEALQTNPTSELVNTAVELAENLPVDQRKKLLEDNVETVKELESAIKQVNKNVQTEVSKDPGPFADNDSEALQDVQAVGLLLATGATDNNSISVQLTEKQEEPLSGEKLRFDLTLTKTAGGETQKLHESLPFPVQITLMLPSGFVYHADRHYEIRHTLQEKTETLPMTITGEPGHYTAVFLTNSFSTFSLMETEIDNSNGEDDDDEDNNKPSNPITQPSNQSQTFASDTTGDFAVNGSYQFKITSKNGKAPVFVVGTPGVFEIQSVTRNGNDYFFGLKAIGAPGDKVGIYVNGVKLLVATVGSNPNYAKLDTGKQLTVKAGKTYQFKVTAAKKPTFVCGTGSTFRITYAGSKGNDYFFKVTATGKAGAKAGFYVNGEKSPRTIGTVA